MKSKIITGMFGLLFVGLLVISGCSQNIQPSPNKDKNIDDGQSADYIKYGDRIRSLKEWKNKCSATTLQVNAFVVKKRVCPRDNTGVGEITSVGDETPPSPVRLDDCFISGGDMLVIGDVDGVTEDYSFTYGQIDGDVWDDVQEGKRYLFTIQEGKILAAEEGSYGETLAEYKRVCSAGPSTFKGKVADLYYCTPPGEGVVFKCGEGFLTLKDDNEQMKFTRVDKNVFEKVGLGQEYIFIFGNDGVQDAMTLEEYAALLRYRPVEKDENLLRLREGIAFDKGRIQFLLEKIDGDGVVVIRADDEISFAIRPGSELITRGCVRIQHAGVDFSESEPAAYLFVEQASGCNDAIYMPSVDNENTRGYAIA